jgi:hypothetical protein
LAINYRNHSSNLFGDRHSGGTRTSGLATNIEDVGAVANQFGSLLKGKVWGVVETAVAE